MCTNTYTAKETSFWKFIQENEIDIPIIQRDYAQGREGKESLRKNFLADLKNALDSENTLKLDFVYGSVEDQKMNPLDGQQRLTTLWLLHWYIALMADKLDKGACENLKKFSYETRITSREFCKELCKPNNFKDFYNYKPKESRRIVSYIKSRTWFYSAWNQDPTIQSMLRMLGGTKITDKKGEDIVDGIEELFEGTNDFGKYWTNLTSDTAPIVFYHLPLKDFGLSDDLYIKMNARGKQLTNFENFKADLIGYIRQQAKNEDLEKDQQDSWKKLLDPEKGIPILMDTKWTDIFWKNKSDGIQTEDREIILSHQIDDIYLTFIKRFFLNELIKNDKEEEKIDEKDSKYKYLSNETLDYDSGSFVHFKELINLERLKNLRTILNRISDFYTDKDKNKTFCYYWDNNFTFIPEYSKNGDLNDYYIDDNGNKHLKVKEINQRQRIVFYGICNYFMSVEYKECSFEHWKRFIWNLTSTQSSDGGDVIRNVDEMRNAIDLINKITNPRKVYEDLYKKQPRDYTGSLLKEQFAEEIIKAKQILNSDGTLRQYDGSCRNDKGKLYETWEGIIIEAENYAFFKGSIRFLYQDAEGKTNWDNFDTKWANAQNYFDKNGVKDNYKVDLTKALVVQCDNWGEQLYDTQIFNPNANTWKWILCSEIWKTPINNILIDLKNIQCSQSLNDDNANRNITSILDHLPYDTFVKEEPTGRFRFIEDRLAYYKPYGRRYIIFDWNNFSRNKTLRELKKVLSIDNSRNPVIDNSALSFWWGWNIYFKFQNCFFLWSGNPNNVYLMLDCWNDYKKREPTIDSVQDKDKYYCFKVDGNMAPDAFIEKLNDLIDQAKKYKNQPNSAANFNDNDETQEYQS